jgi:hypothetical protein
VRLARRRVVATSLATFVLAWGVVAFDGSMGATTAASSGTTESTTTADGGTSTDSGESSSSSSESDDASADLTTSQS